jgi:rod shape determining protein RodA
MMLSGYDPYTKYKSKLSHLPPVLCVLILIMVAISLTALYSASLQLSLKRFYNQIIYFICLIPLMLAVASMHLRWIYRYSYFIYGFSLVILLIVEFIGHKAMGATRWINLGLIKLQPSELIKVTTLLFLSRYFHNLSLKQIYSIKSLLLPTAIVGLSSLVILQQPDLGTAILLLSMTGFVYFTCGVRIWKFGASLALLIGSTPFIWAHLRDYQKTRVLSFLNPEKDALGSGYNIIQSKIAIGSGGLYGKGFGEGTQSQLSFIPEQQTDFIFTVIAEEFGFTGSVILLIIQFLLSYSAISIGMHCRNDFGKILACGVSSLFFLQTIINLGMVSGIMPVVGVPLPLISYGGSMLLTMMISFGLVINVHLHRNTTINID